MIKIYKPVNILRLTQLLLIIAWLMLVVVLMTLKPNSSVEVIASIPFMDKLVHFVVFGWLARLVCGWLARYTEISLKKVVALASIWVFFLACYFEVVQEFLTYRSASFWDLSAGMWGAVVFSLIWYQWQKKHPRRLVKEKLLLHVCCGPCGADLTGGLDQRFKVTLFFTNSNIDTKEEFKLRWRQVKKMARHHRVEAILESYDHAEWLALVKGLEHEPERGVRCPVCFRARLDATARLAKKLNFDWFSTTLSVSPHKDFMMIKAIGQSVGAKYGVHFLAEDFKKQEGYKKSIVAANKLKLYRQDYCGCEFAKNHLPKKKTLNY